ncbi:MAG TPA: NAD(P)H-dependent oxidoreductase [Acidimicrobiia bacterium]|nr:NAD(P)H-dependent oxidoreductase [Acidimicrobiia bacterium]
MRALVLIAHPDDDSFCHAAAGRAVAGLRRAGHEVDVVDLYAQRYRAAMSLEEHLAYESDDPIKDPQVADHADLLQRAEILVFVYPTWWSGLPAILRGWLERTMVPGVSFHLDPRTNKVRPGLQHVRRIVGITTWRARRPTALLVNDNGRRVITRALRMSCGFRTRTTWLAHYGISRSTVERRTAFLDRIETKMAGI